MTAPGHDRRIDDIDFKTPAGDNADEKHRRRPADHRQVTAPPYLAGKGNPRQKKHLLEVDDQIGRPAEMQTAGHFSKDNDQGDRDGRPLQSVKK